MIGRSRILSISVLGALVATSALGATKETADQKFITNAVEGNLGEIQLGQMAQQSGSSDAVKSFGQMLASDHTTANQAATAAATSLGLTPPTQPAKAAQAEMTKLQKLSGAKFDAEFARYMVSDHKKDIKDYTTEAGKGTDPAAGYAKAQLPTLQKHLATAQSLVPTNSARK